MKLKSHVRQQLLVHKRNNQRIFVANSTDILQGHYHKVFNAGKGKSLSTRHET